ncbi:hypothetical protein PHYBOEH_008772 [Phytophthora boehmeriae]|uniref:RxLR effector protein n=1 Tax=Phytophthora boehmeriae TaxID=109152 RepID=A0A8T1VXK0_9STRA|nr:hypothetical protein PHYBOEH_008772 [Phytophthora boehmeriae]
MRLSFVVILAASVLLAAIDATPVTTNVKHSMISPDDPIGDHSNIAGLKDNSKRSLRGDSDGNYVERRLPSVQDVLKFDKWIDKGHTKETIFKKLGLTGLGEAVFTHPNWETYKKFGRYYHKVTGVQL